MCSIRIAGNQTSVGPPRASVHTSHGDGQIWITGQTNSHRYCSVMRKTVSKCNHSLQCLLYDHHTAAQLPNRHESERAVSLKRSESGLVEPESSDEVYEYVQ